MSVLGNNIKHYRKKACLTQTELAHKCGLKPGTIQQYESGKREPKMEIIDKISSALGVKIIDLVEKYSFQEYQKTNEYQKIMAESESFHAIIMILKELYGKIENKEVSGNYACSNYYLCGDNADSFILYDNDIDVLLDAIKSLLPPLINRIKDTRPEYEVVEEIKKDCSDSRLLVQTLINDELALTVLKTMFGINGKKNPESLQDLFDDKVALEQLKGYLKGALNDKTFPEPFRQSITYVLKQYFDN